MKTDNTPWRTKHLQTENPILSWEEWLLELCKLFANSLKIDKSAALRHINIDEAKSWYEDGFTPYVCFRENHS